MTHVDNDTIVEGIKCKKCGETLPPHTVKIHLDLSDPIHECPHVVKMTDKEILLYLYKFINESLDSESSLDIEPYSLSRASDYINEKLKNEYAVYGNGETYENNK